MENFKSHFHKVPEDEKEFAEDGIKEWSALGPKLIEGEYEKSPEFIESIEKISIFIEDEMRALGLEPRERLPAERVHIVSEEVGRQIYLTGDGGYNALRDQIAIVVNNPTTKGLRELLVIHEGLHYYGYRAVMALGEKKDIEVYRSGYHVKNSIEGHEHFDGFNEAVVEKMLYEITVKHSKELLEMTGLTGEELIERFESGYVDNIKFIDTFIDKVAVHKNIQPEDVWSELKRGAFTGKMMHLRVADEVFGPGALRVLAAFDTIGEMEDSLDDNTWYEKFSEYLDVENQEDRDRIAKKIITERERLQYEKNSKKPYTPEKWGTDASL